MYEWINWWKNGRKNKQMTDGLVRCSREFEKNEWVTNYIDEWFKELTTENMSKGTQMRWTKQINS